MSFVDAVDVGRVAAAALTSDGHAGKAYTLTGPAALGIAEAAAIIGKVTGRVLRYVDVGEAAARGGMLGAGIPEWMTDAMMELHAIDKAGYAATVSDDVAKVTGKPARSFAEFAAANAASWS